MRVDLRIEPVRKSAVANPIHEMCFNLDVPKWLKVDSRGEDLVIDVIRGQAGVALVGKQRRKRASRSSGYGVAGIVGAKSKLLYDPVRPGDVPAADIACGQEDAAVDDIIVHKAAILGIDL